MLPHKFRFIWASCFRGEDFKKSAHQKQELPVAAMFVKQIWPPQVILVSDWLISKKSSMKLPGQMNQNLGGSILGRFSIKIAFHKCFLPNVSSFGKAVSGKIF
jgi:hypothetical protein